MRKSFLGILLCAACWLFTACTENIPVSRHIENATGFMAEGKLTAASVELKNALQKEQDNSEARLLLGEVYLELGDFHGAVKESRKAAELGAPSGAVTSLLARALLANRNYEELRDLQPYSPFGGDRAVVLAAQALGALAEGNRSVAEFKIKEALSADPKSTFSMLAQARLSFLSGNPQLAQTQLDELLQLTPDYGPAWSLKGDIEQTQGDLDAAEKSYGKAIEILVFNVEERLKRALVHIELAHYDEAGKDIKTLLAAYPKSPGANYAKGRLAFETGDLETAQSSLEQAVAVANSYPLILYYLASTHYLNDNLTQAENYAIQFFTRAPDHIAGRKLLALIRLKSGQYADAEEVLRPVVDFSAYDIGAMNLMAMALERQGKVEESVALLAQAAEMQPSSPQAQVRLGAGRILAGDLEGSVENLEAARALNPDFQQVVRPLVLAYMQKGNFDLALKITEEFREANPESTEPYKLLGHIYMAMEQTTEAKTAFTTALSLAPGDPYASHSLALLALREKQLDIARGYYLEVLEHQTDHLSTLLKLATIAAAEGDDQTMLTYLQRAISAHPQAIEPRLVLARHYLAQNRPEQVAPLFMELGGAHSRNPGVLDIMASAKMARKQYGKAINTLLLLLDSQPGVAQTHYRLATAYAATNDLTNIQTQLEQTLKLNPNHFTAHLALGRLLLLAGDEAGAREQLDALQRENSEHPDVLELAASLANRQGAHEDALKLLNTAFDAAPSTARMLVLARQMNGMGDPKGAQVLQENWVSQHLSDVIARLSLSELYAARQETDRVIEQYEQVLAIDENSVIVLNNLAWHLKDTEPARALEYAERAITLSPESNQAHVTLAVVLLKNGKDKDAVRRIEKALEREPQNPRIIYYKAMIDANAGRNSAALDALKNLLAKDSTFPEEEVARELLLRLQP